MAKKSSKTQILEDHNLGILAELVADPGTSDWLRIQIIQKINEAKGGISFFETIYREGLSEGDCPHCGHHRAWLIPEDVLNELGFVSYKEDPRVPPTTDKESCETYAEACLKKTLTI